MVVPVMEMGEGSCEYFRFPPASIIFKPDLLCRCYRRGTILPSNQHGLRQLKDTVYSWSLNFSLVDKSLPTPQHRAIAQQCLGKGTAGINSSIDNALSLLYAYRSL